MILGKSRSNTTFTESLSTAVKEVELRESRVLRGTE
jgi:hypothetical protein